MKINTENLVSITDANQNFSKVARLVDDKGSAIILKNNKPKYVLVEYKEFDSLKLADNEEISSISKRLMENNKTAYEELASSEKSESD